MNMWSHFWGIVVLFSVISFSYMSVKILCKSIAELKEMFKTLDDRYNVGRIQCKEKQHAEEEKSEF